MDRSILRQECANFALILEDSNYRTLLTCKYVPGNSLQWNEDSLRVMRIL